MTARPNLMTAAPEAFHHVLALEQYGRAHVDADLYELMKLRASMMNGCAYCVDMHGTSLLDHGEPARRVLAVAAWRESTFFTERERTVLELTEAVTHLGPHGVSDELWDATVAELGERGALDLLVGIATINVWNRIAVTTRAEAPALGPVRETA